MTPKNQTQEVRTTMFNLAPMFCPFWGKKCFFSIFFSPIYRLSGKILEIYVVFCIYPKFRHQTFWKIFSPIHPVFDIFYDKILIIGPLYWFFDYKFIDFLSLFDFLIVFGSFYRYFSKWSPVVQVFYRFLLLKLALFLVPRIRINFL